MFASLEGALFRNPLALRLSKTNFGKNLFVDAYRPRELHLPFAGSCLTCVTLVSM